MIFVVMVPFWLVVAYVVFVIVVHVLVWSLIAFGCAIGWMESKLELAKQWAFGVPRQRD